MCLVVDTGGQGATRHICETRVAEMPNNARKADGVVVMIINHLLSHREIFWIPKLLDL